MSGKLITFEGIEGSGKTTQIRLLSDYLNSRKVDHLLTREPGGTRLGDQIRRHLLDAEEPGEIFPETELLLFLAVRAQHLREAVLPALGAGRVVLCDRYSDATLAYQGFGRGLPVAKIREIQRAAGIVRGPDLTLLLDMEVGPALERTRQRGSSAGGQSRFDREGEAFHQKVREGYLKIAETEPVRVRCIDAARPLQVVHGAILDIVNDFLDLGNAACEDDSPKGD